MYVEVLNTNPHEFDQIAQKGMDMIGITYSTFTAKNIHRRQLPLNEKTPVLGTVKTVQAALRQVGAPMMDDCYPKYLQQFLCRKINVSTVGRLKNHIINEDNSFFAKPLGKLKSFTGRVFTSPNDLYWIGNTSDKASVWISEPVKWKSEWRLYLADGKVIGIECYDGLDIIALDDSTISSVLSALAQNNITSCAIDLGVLDTGETALIELNPPYAVDPYGLDAKIYAEFLCKGWAYLCSQR